jgi:preprotein translocase subunit SecD
MRRKILLPLVLILLVAYGGLIATLVSDNSPELGLDLQGGVSVVLAPTDDATGDQLDQSVSIIRDRVDALGVAEPDITRQGDAIVVQLPGVKNRDRALALVGQTAELQFRPVLSSGALPEDEVAEAQDAADAQVSGAGDDDATGGDATGDDDAGATGGDGGSTTETTEAGEATGSEGALGLVEGESAAAPAQEPEPTDPTGGDEGDAGGDGATGDEGDQGEAPADGGQPPEGEDLELTPRDQDDPETQVTLSGLPGDGPAEGTTSVYELGPAQATGRIVRTAQADIQTGQWLVRLEMRGGEDGIDRFNEIAAMCFTQAAECPSGQLAIVLDSVVQSAPTIQQPSFAADQIQISGSFTEGDAKDLALVLRYGALPVELERQSVQTVSASLGDDSLRAGVVAGIVGLILVALFMLVYYRALGLVVVLGLTVWGSLMYTIISFLGETQGLALTLAGVTGIIVSIGITVDSYVVHFERLKEEVKAGRTLRSSSEKAFKQAFRTILAANFTAFLAALILWWLTVGSVRGFAFFLGLATLLDIVVVWAFERPMVTLLSRNRVFTDMPFLGVARGVAAEPPPAPADRPVPASGARR